MAGRVDLWRVQLEAPLSCEDVLSMDEVKRANAFVLAEDRNRYVAAHSALHAILASYLSIRPALVQLEYDHRGRLSIRNSGGPRLNLTHAGEWALFAVSRRQEVGVDIERIQPFERVSAVAERYFTPAERDQIRVAPDPATRFFTYWTRKEAILKLTGDGL